MRAEVLGAMDLKLKRQFDSDSVHLELEMDRHASPPRSGPDYFVQRQGSHQGSHWVHMLMNGPLFDASMHQMYRERPDWD
jgi:hypothetical protein